MSHCLDDVAVRAAADGEASGRARMHLETCRSCQARVSAAANASAEMARMAATIPVPGGLEARVARAAGGRPAAPRTPGGATTLRSDPKRAWLRPAWISGLALATAVLAFVIFMPVWHAPQTLSAAEILGRSLDRWAPRSGTERLEFDLSVDLPSISAIGDGTYRIEQLIDHDTPGRYRVSKYAPDGSLLLALSENATMHQRKVLVRADDRAFLFSLVTGPQHAVDLQDVARNHVEGTIRLLQAMAGQTVTELPHDGGTHYLVELPAIESPGGQTLWQLARARVVIDSSSFEVLVLEASGSYMNEPFTISFRLRERVVRPTATVSPAEFDVPHDPSAIAIGGTGTDDITHDLFTAALHEIARRR